MQHAQLTQKQVWYKEEVYYKAAKSKHCLCSLYPNWQYLLCDVQIVVPMQMLNTKVTFNSTAIQSFARTTNFCIHWYQASAQYISLR